MRARWRPAAVGRAPDLVALDARARQRRAAPVSLPRPAQGARAPAARAAWRACTRRRPARVRSMSRGRGQRRAARRGCPSPGRASSPARRAPRGLLEQRTMSAAPQVGVQVRASARRRRRPSARTSTCPAGRRSGCRPGRSSGSGTAVAVPSRAVSSSVWLRGNAPKMPRRAAGPAAVGAVGGDRDLRCRARRTTHAVGGVGGGDRQALARGEVGPLPVGCSDVGRVALLLDRLVGRGRDQHDAVVVGVVDRA